MKNAVSAVVLGIVLAGCATSTQSSGPNVTIQLAQVNSAPDIFYYAGPVNIQYQVSITDPTNEPLTLTRLDLQSVGPGAYSVRTESTPMNLKVAPNATTNYLISVWGRARGGYLAADEPVSIRGTAYFKGPSSSFVKIFTQNIVPR